MPFTPVIRIPTFLSFYAFSRLFRQLLAFLSSTPVIRFPAFFTRHSFSRLSRPLFVTRNLWRFRQAFSSPITISSSLSRAFDQRFLSLFLTADPIPALFANDLFSLVYLPFTVACLPTLNLTSSVILFNVSTNQASDTKFLAFFTSSCLAEYRHVTSKTYIQIKHAQHEK